MGEKTPVSQPEQIELVPRDIRVGQQFRPFETLTQVPPLLPPAQNQLERVLVRAPFRLIGMEGAVIIGTGGIRTRKSDKGPWRPLAEIGVEFNLTRAVTRDLRRIFGYYLRVLMEGKVRGVQIGSYHNLHTDAELLREDLKVEGKAVHRVLGLSTTINPQLTRVITMEEIPYGNLERLRKIEAEFGTIATLSRAHQRAGLSPLDGFQIAS